MPDRDKVIKGLEYHSEGNCFKSEDDETGCPYWKDSFCSQHLCSDALALLKAQEPVEPVVDIDTLKCGNCGHTLEHQELLGDNVLFHEQYNYCPGCGKPVKWDG